MGWVKVPQESTYKTIRIYVLKENSLKEMVSEQSLSSLPHPATVAVYSWFGLNCAPSPHSHGEVLTLNVTHLEMETLRR